VLDGPSSLSPTQLKSGSGHQQTVDQGPNSSPNKLTSAGKDSEESKFRASPPPFVIIVLYLGTPP
jgi:hypothetical protein